MRRSNERLRMIENLEKQRKQRLTEELEKLKTDRLLKDQADRIR